MRYFTPELYLRFNSPDRAKMARAHDDWEDALQAYRRHLQQIGPQMSLPARNVAESLCLHDADYLGMAVVPMLDVGKSLAVLLARQNARRVCLVYLLDMQPLIQESPPRWPFSKDQVHWLYDEFDVDQCGLQQHEVLLSNGQILTLRFHEMQIIEHQIEQCRLAAQS